MFGGVLVDDWSARDIQEWEYAPLGSFLGKPFVTSVSPWAVPLEALGVARTAGRGQDPASLLRLRRVADWGLDIAVEVRLNNEVVSWPPYATMYWTPDQMLARLTSNGAALRTGDLYASGAISGPLPGQRGSLVELTWGGAQPMALADGSVRTFLEGGDVVPSSAPPLESAVAPSRWVRSPEPYSPCAAGCTSTVPAWIVPGIGHCFGKVPRALPTGGDWFIRSAGPMGASTPRRP